MALDIDGTGKLYIDADSLLYQAHFGVEKTFEAGRFDLIPYGWAKSSWGEMLDTGVLVGIDTVKGYEILINKVENIVSALRPSEFELVFTGANNFRYAVQSSYKAKRNRTAGKAFKPKRPLKEVKSLWYEWLKRDGYKIVVCNGYEADDYVATRRRDDSTCTIAATDKDVRLGIAGRNYNYSTGSWEIVSYVDAMLFPYKQAIMGDSSDGISGLHKKGKVFADKLLEGVDDELVAYERVRDAYTDDERTVEELTNTMRLLSLHQVYFAPQGYEIRLWQPPTYSRTNGGSNGFY